LQAVADNCLRRVSRASLLAHDRAAAVGVRSTQNEAYIAGETQATKIAWAAAADGLEANDADGEAFSFTTVKA